MASITMRFLAEPSTVNFGGKVHGGTVMKWIDEAGYACATHWAKRYCVTVFIGSVRFHRPIMIGDLVEVEAHLAYTGNSSMNISVEVRSGDLKSGELHKTTECLIVFVAVDADGKSMPVDAYSPSTPGEMALAARAKAHLDASRAAGARAAASEAHARGAASAAITSAIDASSISAVALDTAAVAASGRDEHHVVPEAAHLRADPDVAERDREPGVGRKP
ncbi:Acyl-CoA hydrolase (modular protein) [Burkholderiales bacterium 8X]|nr:Acyl-CoA hydrolase (modular protein) [Burkholderiales bacterium 8X]